MNSVFISYRHESEQHAAKVAAFAKRLKADGLPVVLDQFFVESHPGGPDETWLRWCDFNAEKSACVLICCSRGWFESYYGKGPKDGGRGAATEAMFFRSRFTTKKESTPGSASSCSIASTKR